MNLKFNGLIIQLVHFTATVRVLRFSVSQGPTVTKRFVLERAYPGRTGKLQNIERSSGLVNLRTQSGQKFQNTAVRAVDDLDPLL